MDPQPFTYAELLAMSRGRSNGEFDLFLTGQEDAWERSAQIIAMLYNSNCKKEDALDPDEFNAWLRVPGIETVDAEKQRREDEIIAERRSKIAAEKAAKAVTDGK